MNMVCVELNNIHVCSGRAGTGLVQGWCRAGTGLVQVFRRGETAVLSFFDAIYGESRLGRGGVGGGGAKWKRLYDGHPSMSVSDGH